MIAYVTGVAGFLGSEIARQLLDLGYRVYGCDNFATSDQKNVPDGLYHFDEADIQDLYLGNIRPHIIFHTAAIARSAWEDETEIYRTNLHGTTHVLEEAVAHGAYLVHCSSCVTNLPQTNAYSMSKYLAEKIALSNPDGSTVIKYCNIYGPGQSTKGAEPNVLAKWKMQRDNGEDITLHGSSNVREFVHVKDAARATIMAAFQPGLFDVRGESQTMFQLAKKFGEAVRVPDRLNDPHSWYPLIQVKPTVVPGYKPLISFDAGLEEFLAS